MFGGVKSFAPQRHYMAGVEHREVSADELSSDEAGQELLAAAARAATIVSSTAVPAHGASLDAQWTELYISTDANISVGEGAYTAMAEDATRPPKFAEALRRRLEGTRDCIVLDVGTGPFALLAMIAARHGARRVYAIEANAAAAAERAALEEAEGEDEDEEGGEGEEEAREEEKAAGGGGVGEEGAEEEG